MLALTTSEVVALFGVDEARIRKDAEYSVVSRTKPLRFELADVVYFLAIADFPFELGVDSRKECHHKIVSALAKHRPPSSVAWGKILRMNLDSVVDAVQARVSKFQTWKKKKIVERDDILGGEPVFAKSRLSVRHIGAMANRGASVKEICEDYPNLTSKDVEFAKLYANAYPRVGRPRAGETST